MGEQVHKHIYDVNLAWGQFLDFYSDLNNARKAHEDTFVDRQYIGEELQEPDEQPMNNHELLDDNYDDREDAKDQGDFFNAFEDGFDNILEQRRSSVIENQSIYTKPSKNSENMLGELQKEISQEENKNNTDD